MTTVDDDDVTSTYFERLTDERADRRAFVGQILTGVAIVTVLLSLIIAVFIATQSDRNERQRQHQRQQQIATTCINMGGIWIAGNCIPGRR